METPSSPSPARILVIRGGAIGDFILTLPVFSALRAGFSSCRLEVLGYPHIAQLALAGGLADEMRSIEDRSLAFFFAANGDLDPALAAYFKRFALIISFLFDPDEIFQTNVRRCTKAQFIAGPHRPDERQLTHATEVFLKALEPLAIFGSDPRPRLDLDERTAVPSVEVPSTLHERPSSGTAGALALHPGSGSEKKNWPEPCWQELIRHLVDETSYELFLVGGEAERERIQRLREGLPNDRVRVLQSLPLGELAARMRGCRAFIGHDSGITHLATALGLPGLVLWGETNEAIWRPRSDRLIFLKAGAGLDQLSVSTVIDGLVRLTAEEDVR